MQLLILIRAKNQLSIRSFLVKTDQSDVLGASGVVGCGREIEIEAFPLLAVICLGLKSSSSGANNPLPYLPCHVFVTGHSTQLVKTPTYAGRRSSPAGEQLSRAAHAKRHLMETPLVMLTGHQLHHRDFQGPGWRQVPTPTSSHRQPDHSVLGEEWVWCVPVFSCVACRILEYHKMFLHVQ